MEPAHMTALKALPWNWLAPAIRAACMLGLLALTGQRGLHDAYDRTRTEPWPLLLAAEPAVDPAVAMLQWRADITLARLIEAGQPTE
jgi:hypothetical protein